VFTRDVQTAIRLGEPLSDGRRSPGDSSEPPTQAIVEQSRRVLAHGDLRCEIPVSCPFSN
jgi:hypothetical protein